MVRGPIAIGALLASAPGGWAANVADEDTSLLAAGGRHEGRAHGGRHAAGDSGGGESKSTKVSWLANATQTTDAASPVDNIAPAALRPHILLWVTDDQGWSNVGYHNSLVSTPNMDKLSSEGIRLDRHYTGSWCVPSRASMLTGRLPHNMIENRGHTIPEGVMMIPAMLSKAGYVSHQVGKWHLGNQKTWQLPYKRGFSTSFGYLGSVNDYYTQKQTADSWPCDGTDLWRTDRPAKGEEGHFSLPLYSSEVTRIIKSHNPKTPLFMYVALQAMHSPAPTSRLNATGPITAHGLEKHLAHYQQYGDGFATGNSLISAADEVLGEAVIALKGNQNMYKQTLLVHTSDNGASVTPIGQEVRGTNYPLRGGKNTNFEGGVRVPAFVTGGALPAQKHGVIKDGYIHAADWYATFAHVAGIKFSDAQNHKIDSLNMWPWLSGEAADSPRTGMVLGLWSPRKGATDALIHGNYKLIEGEMLCDGWTQRDYPQFPRDYNASSGLDCDPGGGKLLDPHKLYDSTQLARSTSKTGWLFDIKHDPSEKHNLYNHPATAEVQKNMEAMLHEMIKKSDGRLNGDPDVTRDDLPRICSKYVRANHGYLGPYLDD